MYEELDLHLPFWVDCLVCRNSIHQDHTMGVFFVVWFLLLFFKGDLSHLLGDNWSPGMPFPFGKTSAAMCIYCGPLAGNAKSEFSSQPVVEKSIHSFSPNICFLGDVLNSFCPFLGALVKKVERSDVTCDST